MSSKKKSDYDYDDTSEPSPAPADVIEEPVPPPPLPTPRPDGLLGLCFEVFGEGGAIDRRGMIISDLGNDHYLAEYMEATDPRDTMTVIHIGKITEPSGDRHGPGAWRLYEAEEAAPAAAKR